VADSCDNGIVSAIGPQRGDSKLIYSLSRISVVFRSRIGVHSLSSSASFTLVYFHACSLFLRRTGLSYVLNYYHVFKY